MKDTIFRWILRGSIIFMIIFMGIRFWEDPKTFKVLEIGCDIILDLKPKPRYDEVGRIIEYKKQINNADTQKDRNGF